MLLEISGEITPERMRHGAKAKTIHSCGSIRTKALSNSMKLSHACGATQDGRVMVERSDTMWSTGEENSKPLQYSCLEKPMSSMKRQNCRILKEVLSMSVGAQYATGGQWKSNSRKNEVLEPGVGDGQGGLVCCNSWGRKESDTTEQLN